MDSPLTGVNWAAILSAVSILSGMIGGMLTVVYKLIVANLARTTAIYDERVQHVTNTFQAALLSRDKVEEERTARHKQEVTTLLKKFEKVEREQRELLKDLPRQYVAREDFLKSVTVLEIKVDRIGENILQMAKEAK